MNFIELSLLLGYCNVSSGLKFTSLRNERCFTSFVKAFQFRRGVLGVRFVTCDIKNWIKKLIPSSGYGLVDSNSNQDTIMIKHVLIVIKRVLFYAVSSLSVFGTEVSKEKHLERLTREPQHDRLFFIGNAPVGRLSARSLGGRTVEDKTWSR